MVEDVALLFEAQRDGVLVGIAMQTTGRPYSTRSHADMSGRMDVHFMSGVSHGSHLLGERLETMTWRGKPGWRANISLVGHSHGMNHVVLMLYLANSLSSRSEPTSPAYTPYNIKDNTSYMRTRGRLKDALHTYSGYIRR